MKHFIILLLSFFAITAHAQDMTPVATVPVTQVGFERVINPLRSPYFSSIYEHKSTIRFINNVAWFIDSHRSIEINQILSYQGICFRKYIGFEPCFQEITDIKSFSTYGLKHNDLNYRKYYSRLTAYTTKRIYLDDYGFDRIQVREPSDWHTRNNDHDYSDMFFSME